MITKLLYLNSILQIGLTHLIGISIGVFIIFFILLFLIIKKKNKAKLSLNTFSKDIQEMLKKYESYDDKIKALEILIERISNEKSYNKNPDFRKSVLSKVYEQMATIYNNAGNEDGVINSCSQIITLDPSNGMSYYNRGSIYSNWGDYEKALADFNDAAILLPNYASLYNNRGMALEQFGRLDEALIDYNHAIELEPSPIIYYNRGNLLYEMKKYNEAKEDYEKYLTLDPEDKYELTIDVRTSLTHIDNKLSEEADS